MLRPLLVMRPGVNSEVEDGCLQPLEEGVRVYLFQAIELSLSLVLFAPALLDGTHKRQECGG